MKSEPTHNSCGNVQNVWNVLCGRVVTDKETNNVSLLDVIERVAIHEPEADAGKQAIALRAVIVSLWSRVDLATPTSALARLSIIGPDGSALIDQPQEMKVDLTGYHRIRTMGQLQAIPVVRGLCRFIVELECDDGWLTVGSIPIEIVFDDTETAPQSLEVHSDKS